MTKNAKIITLVVVMLVALILSIVMVSVYATTHDNEVSSNGFTVEKSGSNCVISSYTGTDETVKIPNKIAGKKVVGIKTGVFKNNDKIRNIEFNGTFENLELSEYVFTDIPNLTYVKLPEGLKKIPTGAFRKAYSLTHVSLPNSLEVIGEYAFQGCNTLEYSSNPANDSSENKKFYFSNNIIKVEKSAFSECTSLKTVVVNDKLETLGDSAFQEATRLSKVEISKESKLAVISDYAFADTKISSSDNNEESKLIFPNLKTIGKGAFARITSNLLYFEFSKTLESIGDEAFLGTKALSKVVFDEEFKPKSFGKSVFRNCVNLKEIKPINAESTANNSLPKNMKTIPELTFSGCVELLYSRDLYIHKDIEEIGPGALAIYNITESGQSGRQLQTKKNIVIDKDNDYFKVVNLQKFYIGSSRGTTYDHFVITTFDESELVAYIGKYSTYSYTGTDDNKKYSDAYRVYDRNGNEVLLNANLELYNAFTYLDVDPDLRNNLKTIRSYAFAGVRFNQLLIPNSVTLIKDYAFINSDITEVLFDKPDCEFEEKAFSGMHNKRENEDFIMICVTRNDANFKGTIHEQFKEFEKNGLVIGFKGRDMFK